MSNLISIYPIVLWQKPLRPNGVILLYELTFTRNGSTKTPTTNALQTFFAANEESLPEGTGSFTVQVSAHIRISHQKQAVKVHTLMC